MSAIPIELVPLNRDLFKVVSDPEDIPAFLEMGQRAEALGTRRLDARLPRGPGSEVLLVGADVERFAGDFYQAGVASVWFMHLPPGYDTAADWSNAHSNLTPTETLARWHEFEGSALLLRASEYKATGDPRAPRPVSKAEHKVEVVTLTQLASRPRPRDLVARMLPEGALLVPYGAPKSGKTYVSIDMGLAVADGRPFLGRATRQGTVVYVAGEGIGGIVDKVMAAVGVARVLDPHDPLHQRFVIVPSMPSLAEPGGLAGTLRALDGLDERPVLVIIDTMARALGASGLDENATQDMGVMVRALDTIRERTGAAIVTPHHSGKNGGDRGSSALRGAADVFARIERAGPLCSRITIEDMRDGEPPEPIDFTFGRSVVRQDEHGDVVRWFIDGHQAADANENANEADAILQALANNPDGLTRSKVQAEAKREKSQASSRLRDLVAQGRVEVVPNSNPPIYRLATVRPGVRSPDGTGRTPDDKQPLPSGASGVLIAPDAGRSPDDGLQPNGKKRLKARNSAKPKEPGGAS